MSRKNRPTKPGANHTITRSARRLALPAIMPGELSSSSPNYSSSELRRSLLYRIRTLCDGLRGQPMPRFQLYTSKMDRWLQWAMREERTGFLAAFTDQAAMINSNRHWRMVGLRSLVDRTSQLLHLSDGGAPDGGFRNLVRKAALNFYSSNHGGSVYLHRTDPVSVAYLKTDNTWHWNTPPVLQMFSTDPTLFVPRQGDYIYPFEYNGDVWSRFDFFRTVSMPSTQMETWNVGRCPLWRNIQVARMTSSIYDHIHNLVSPDTAKGILTIKGMTGDEFFEALMGSEAVNESDITSRSEGNAGSHPSPLNPNNDLGEIVVLADRDQEITVKFVLLSRFPDGFVLNDWIRWTLTSFATNLGFPLEEFIGMPANRLLGQSGAEVQAGQVRGATKGGADFINQFQEAMQQLVIPGTVHFEFAERDEQGELNDLSIQERQIKMVTDLFEATQTNILNQADPSQDTLLETRAKGQHIIDREEARRFLVELGALPEWFGAGRSSQSVIDDSLSGVGVSVRRLRELRDWAMSQTRVRNHLANSGITNEPIVAYDNWVDAETGLLRESETVLWSDVGEMTSRQVWPVPDSSGIPSSMNRSTSTAPGIFRSQASGGQVTLHKNALGSEHSRAIRKTIGKILANHAKTSEEEDGAYPPIEFARSTVSPSNQGDAQSISARVYAIAQLGRDNVIGRKSVQEPDMVAMAGDMQSFSTTITDLLLMDGEGGPVGSETLAPDCAWISNSLMGMARLVDGPEQLKELALTAADDLTCRAFVVGQYLAAEALGMRKKKWICDADCAHHGDLYGQEQSLYGEFTGENKKTRWPGMVSGCRCSVSFSS